jgi:hypothetical protein
VITTDHGRDEKTGKNHGGQTPRQRTTWMVTNLSQINAYARYSQPAIVDILPTIARHLKIAIAKEREIDGVPLTGPVSLAHPKAVLIQDKIDVSWQVYDEKGTAKVWLSTANQLQTGGKDHYHYYGEVPVSKGHVLLNVKDKPSDFYKVLIEGPHNTINRWVIVNQKK